MLYSKLHLVLNIFLSPFSTTKLIGDFWTNRRSAAKSLPRFAYSFVPYTVCSSNTLGGAIFPLLTGEAQQIKKSVDFRYFGGMHTGWPIATAMLLVVCRSYRFTLCCVLGRGFVMRPN
jgi:hypothetical protein